jgi:hypothetical protein
MDFMDKDYSKSIEIKRLIDWVAAFYGDEGSDFLYDYKEERLEAYKDNLNVLLNYFKQYKDDCINGNYQQAGIGEA